MNVYYIKRLQSHESKAWGTQVSCVRTMLMRATVTGSIRTPKRPVTVHWEWVCTGQRIEGKELERLFRIYPICEFQSDEDLMWRIKRDNKATEPEDKTVACACGDEFPLDSYGGGFLDAKGKCFGCDAEADAAAAQLLGDDSRARTLLASAQASQLLKADTVALWHAVDWMQTVLREWGRQGCQDEQDRAQYDRQRQHLKQAKQALRKVNQLRKEKR